MKLITTLLSIATLLFTSNVISQSSTNTYTAANISTNLSSYSAACNGPVNPLVVTIPAGANVTSIDISYDMVAQGGAWMSEQRSQIHCQETTTTEATLYSGTGGSSGGTESYSRTGVTIANGISATGTLTFEMQAWRTWGSAPAGCNTNYQYINNNTWTITVHYNIPGPMSFVSTTTNQNNTSNSQVCTSNQEIIGIEVVTTGSTSPLDLTQLRIRTAGSTSPVADVTNIDIYYTGTSPAFATTTLFGSAAPAGTGTNIFVNGSQTLASGTNYFWVAYDINGAATLGNQLDAICNRITVDGSNYPPSTTNPGAGRTISACAGTPGGTSQTTQVWLKANDGTTPSVGTGTLTNWNNHGVNGAVTVHGTPDFDENGYNFNPKTHFNGDNNYISYPGNSFGSIYAVVELEDLTRVNTHLSTWTNVSTFQNADANMHGGANGGLAAYAQTGYASEFDPMGSWRMNGNNVAHNANYTGNHDIVSTVASAGDLSVFGDMLLGGQHAGVSLPQRDWLGDASEIIVLSSTSTAAEREQIESYLAIKYGLTLGINGTSKDYVATTGSVVWDQSANAGFNWDITGISRDDATNQDQRKSHTEMWTGAVRNDIVTVANGTNFATPAMISADRAFLVWGHDNGTLQNTNVVVNYPTDNAEVIETIFTRRWKSQESGTLGTVTLEFDLSAVIGSGGLLGNNDLANLRLLVDEDNDYTDGGATSIAPSSYNNGTGIAYFQVDFVPPSGPETNQNRGFFFTLGSTNAITTPLPVEFGSFDSECLMNETEITWTTLSESDSKRFDILTSRDGQIYNLVGSVETSGSSTSENEYNLSLPKFNGTEYVKLIQYDFNETPTVFGPFSVNCEGNQVFVYPNPANEVLNILAKGYQVARISILDFSGRTIIEQEMNLKTLQTIDIRSLASGLYTIVIEQNSNLETIKFSKK